MEGMGVTLFGIAQGSLKELKTHLLLASRVQLRVSQKIAPILKRGYMFGKMLLALICSVQKKQGVVSGE